MTEGIGWGRKRLIHKIVTSHWSVKTPEEKTFSYNELLFILQELLVEEGKPYLESGPSLRGFDVFKDFVKHLMYRNLANFDSMILLTADKGMGKSSAAIMIAREWCRLIGIKFNPRRHIAYNNADVMNKIEALGKFEPLIADEAVRFATAADWAKRENKSLKIKLAQVRTKHLLYILCFPLKIAKVDKVYLESFTNYWCLSGDSKILIKDKSGIKNINMKELINKTHEYTIASYDIKNRRIVFNKTDGCVLTKKEAEVYEIELVNGQKIKATKEHLFLTKNGYKKLMDLREDDLIVCK